MTRNTTHCLLCKIIAVLCVAVMIVYLPGVMVDAGNMDSTSEAAGYHVDLDMYKPVKWYSRSYFYTYYKDNSGNHEVGFTAIDWGVTRAKKKSDGKYLDIIMSRMIMQGKGSGLVYGYSNRLVASSFLNSGQELFSVTPLNTPPSNVYTLGFSLGAGKEGLTAGFSGEKTFVEDALEIYNETDYAAKKPRVRFEYYRDTFIWQNKLARYCYDPNEQLMAYSIRTTNSKYLARITVDAEFKLYSSKPGGITKRLYNRNIYANSSRTVVFYTPY